MNLADRQQLVAKHCSALFWHGGASPLCSCADGILASIEAMRPDGNSTLYADEDWRLIRDPKMNDAAGLAGMHYTAWSMRSELSSINDLDASHVELLQRLVREGARAIAAVHPGVAVEDLQVFTHFPPNIFRLHVHFVHTGVPMWAPDNEVVPVQTLVSEMRTRVRRSPPRITCASWN